MYAFIPFLFEGSDKNPFSKNGFQKQKTHVTGRGILFSHDMSLYGYSCLSSSTISADNDPIDDPFDHSIDLFLSRLIECIEHGHIDALLNIHLSLATQRRWFPNRTRALFQRLAVYFDSPRFVDRWDRNGVEYSGKDICWDDAFRSFLLRWCSESSCLLY